MRKVGEILRMFERFPLADAAMLLQGRRPLILAPHPDDESLGCGGLIASACALGLAPVVAILTDGAASHPGSRAYPPRRLAALREQEAARAMRVLGLPAGRLFFFRQPDTALPATGAAFELLVRRAGELGRAHGCGLVIGPWRGDPHCDHEAAAMIAAAAARRQGWPLFSYPVWGWLRERDAIYDERRNRGWRLSIAGHSRRKQRAIAAHASQYGRLITDSPRGFRLPEDLLAIFSRPFEVFIT